MGSFDSMSPSERFSLPEDQRKQDPFSYEVISQLKRGKNLLPEYLTKEGLFYLKRHGVNICRGFLEKTRQGKMTQISSVALRPLTRYWRDLTGSDFTKVSSCVSKEQFLRIEMKEFYPFTMKKEDFFISLLEHFDQNLDALPESRYQAFFKLFDSVARNQFPHIGSLTVKLLSIQTRKRQPKPEEVSPKKKLRTSVLSPVNTQ
jgi:hypothetical protein